MTRDSSFSQVMRNTTMPEKWRNISLVMREGVSTGAKCLAFWEDSRI